MSYIWDTCQAVAMTQYSFRKRGNHGVTLRFLPLRSLLCILDFLNPCQLVPELLPLLGDMWSLPCQMACVGVSLCLPESWVMMASSPGRYGPQGQRVWRSENCRIFKGSFEDLPCVISFMGLVDGTIVPFFWTCSEAGSSSWWKGCQSRAFQIIAANK